VLCSDLRLRWSVNSWLCARRLGKLIFSDRAMSSSTGVTCSGGPPPHPCPRPAGRRIAERVIASFPSCPIPEVARLGRTLRAWRQQVLAYFDTSGVSNGGTEAVNLLIEKTRRLAHGFRNFDNYRLRILLVADGSRPYRQRPNHAQ
jgi:hypothetical protein